MALPAPYLPLAISVEIGSGGWKADLRVGAKIKNFATGLD
jgi:hypothetical protein